MTGLTFLTGLLEGNVPEALGRLAEAAGADLVVLTTHGRGRLWLGSVADKVVRGGTLPVLLRPRAHSPRGVKAAGVLAARCYEGISG
jgi:nucleotide-binding universal stress UspA family protein